MMYLRAGFADKLNTNYSIFITFPYNQSYVDLIKTLKVRVWNNDKKYWEVPYSDYTPLITMLNTYGVQYNAQDFLKSIDDLSKQVEAMQTIQKQEANVDVSCLDEVDFKTKPYEYQKEGIAYGLIHDRYLNADDQGLGKSLQCLNTALLKRGGKHCLIIVGYKSLLFNWVAEIEKHTNEKGYVIGQRQGKRNKRWKTGKLPDRMDDIKTLNEREEFFLITDVTTLRQCVKQEYVNKKGKKSTFKTFPYADALEEWCRKGEIGRIIVDEIQTCVHGKDLVMVNNHGISVEKLYNRFNRVSYPLYINCLNEKTGEMEQKQIMDMYKSEQKVDFIRIELEYEGKYTTLEVTPEHKILTKNRGWIQAKRLKETDDIVVDEAWFKTNLVNNYYCTTCKECGKTFIRSGKTQQNDFCSTSCSAKWRTKNYEHPCKGRKATPEQIEKWRKTWESKPELREEYSKRMKENNPSSKAEVQAKIKKTKTEKGIANKFTGVRGGNGHISAIEELVKPFLEDLGFVYNKALSTKTIRSLFPEKHFSKNYKPDFYNETLKIAIELDGHSHKTKIGKERDLKKEEFYEFTGIEVLRFENKYVIEHFSEFKDRIRNTCQLQK